MHLFYQVSEWELGEAGLTYDRRWMIVNDGGVYMSQKRIPHLCLIKPSIDRANKHLILAYKGNAKVEDCKDLSLQAILKQCQQLCD